MPNCLNDVLEDRERTANEVKDDIYDGPADCALSLVVQIDLIKN